jgi:hypothetical protein
MAPTLCTRPSIAALPPIESGKPLAPPLCWWRLLRAAAGRSLIARFSGRGTLRRSMRWASMDSRCELVGSGVAERCPNQDPIASEVCVRPREPIEGGNAKRTPSTRRSCGTAIVCARACDQFADATTGHRSAQGGCGLCPALALAPHLGQSARVIGSCSRGRANCDCWSIAEARSASSVPVRGAPHETPRARARISTSGCPLSSASHPTCAVSP